MKKLLFLGLCLIVSGALNSCKKDDPKIVGCMDPSSESYNPKATIDGGNCVYTSKVVFYLTKFKKVGRVTIKIDGDSVGVLTKSVTSMPNCHEEKIEENHDYFTFKKILPGKSFGYDLTAYDDSGNVWKGTLNMKAGQCFSYELP